MTSSLGAARLSNDLLHVLNLGLAAAESTELGLLLVNVSTLKFALTVSGPERSHGLILSGSKCEIVVAWNYASAIGL